jgi:adenine-specific DNA glycosylase
MAINQVWLQRFPQRDNPAALSPAEIRLRWDGCGLQSRGPILKEAKAEYAKLQ